MLGPWRDTELFANVGKGFHSNDARGNVFDSKDSDVTYFYESQLAGESEPTADVHFHPVEPRTLRLTLTTKFCRRPSRFAPPLTRLYPAGRPTSIAELV